MFRLVQTSCRQLQCHPFPSVNCQIFPIQTKTQSHRMIWNSERWRQGKQRFDHSVSRKACEFYQRQSILLSMWFYLFHFWKPPHLHELYHSQLSGGYICKSLMAWMTGLVLMRWFVLGQRRRLPKFVVKEMESMYVEELRSSINLLMANLESLPVSKGQDSKYSSLQKLKRYNRWGSMPLSSSSMFASSVVCKWNEEGFPTGINRGIKFPCLNVAYLV